METERAYAKVNLCLYVVGQRDDGYHFLESLVVFAGVSDVLTATPADALSLTVTGPKAAGVPSDSTNLVLRAAKRLQELRGVRDGAQITLEKHLPHGGGIGGGSADAAAAIRLLARLWNVAPLRSWEASALGADVPVCLMSPNPTVMRGIGDELSPAPKLPKGWLVLVNPGVHVSTPLVFKEFDAGYGPSSHGLEPFPNGASPLAHEDFAIWLLGQRNDLTKVVAEAKFAPVIQAEILPRLRKAKGCMDTDMSGSGSTCWAWFAREADAVAAAAELSTGHPEWWVVAAPVLDRKPALS